jgi:hypothetical protein
VNVKNQILADKSKRRMNRTNHDLEPAGGEEEHFFHTHKVPTEPVSFFHAGEAALDESPKTASRSANWKDYAGSALAIAAAGATYALTKTRAGKKLMKAVSQWIDPKAVTKIKKTVAKAVGHKTARPQRAAANRKTKVKATAKSNGGAHRAQSRLHH